MHNQTRTPSGAYKEYDPLTWESISDEGEELVMPNVTRAAWHTECDDVYERLKADLESCGDRTVTRTLREIESGRFTRTLDSGDEDAMPSEDDELVAGDDERWRATEAAERARRLQRGDKKGKAEVPLEKRKRQSLNTIERERLDALGTTPLPCSCVRTYDI